MTVTFEVVEIIRTETIKPNSPTPVDLKSFPLSLLDQIAPVAYIPLLMFYPNVDVDVEERLDRMKKSLAETLNRFYVLAGRVDGYASVDCNDEGADFIEARINCSLSNVLKPPNADVLKMFLPAQIESPEAATGRLLLVQATYFECGGMAVGLCISHKVADASSLSAFVKTWSAAALGRADDVAAPVYIGPSLFPPLDFSIPMPPVELPKSKCTTTRLVFDGAKIVELKLKVASENVPQPTRVEAVTALIWKCAMSSSRSKSGFQKPSFLCHTVNLRKRVDPALPGNSIGNLLSYFTAQTDGQDVDERVLVEKLKSGIKEFIENAKKVQESGFAAIFEGAKELASMWSRDDLDFYTYSSWCKFELYGADFGWGKPSWVSIASSVFSNVVILMDSKDGEGIEAWLTLSEEEMAEFERNEELLEFGSLNPSILI